MWQSPAQKTRQPVHQLTLHIPKYSMLSYCFVYPTVQQEIPTVALLPRNDRINGALQQLDKLEFDGWLF